MARKEKTEWSVIGRNIGTASGWDQADTFVIQLYDFEPAEGVLLGPSDCLTIDFESGKVQHYGENGEPVWTKDLLEVLVGAAKSNA